MTKRQQQLLAFIAVYQRLYGGVSPSYEEMMTGMGMKGSQSLHDMLHRLADQKYLRIEPRKARAITILPRPDLKTCPCCGRGSAA